jgi:Zn-dependent peptidase ImmA (M78 family)
MSSTDRNRVRQTGRMVFEVIQVMADRFKKIDVRLPRISQSDPEEAAKITRAELGYSPDVPIANLVTRLEKNGIVIVSVPDEIEEHDAFSVWADTEPRTPVIVMTFGKSGDRQRWSVAHELGHLVLHYTYSGMLSEIENEADRFAAELLLPEESMRRDLSAPLTLTMLADLKSRWGVSMQALIMRAFQLQIITDGQRRYLFRQMAARKWMKDEPVVIPPEKPRLLRKLAESLYGPNFDIQAVADPGGIPSNLLKPILDAYATIADLQGMRVEKTSSAAVSGRGKLLTMR